MIIGFYDHGIGFRGTTRAMYAYAKLLRDKNDVSVFFDQNLVSNNLSIAAEMLRDGINVRPINHRNELEHQGLDFLYHVTSQGAPNNDWIERISCPVLLHQVGYNRPEFHKNSLFAYTSAWQSAFFTAGTATVLPYLIEPPSEQISQVQARSSLGIPLQATVLGRHGGLDTWNLPFASESVHKVAKQRDDVWFIFVNTPKFCDLPNVRFIPGTSNRLVLENYLSACDAMLHARWEGETFGLACAEFLIRNKPIITWSASREKNHLLLADSSAITYNHYNDLELVLGECTRSVLEKYAEKIPRDLLLSNYGQDAIQKKLLNLLAYRI